VRRLGTLEPRVVSAAGDLEDAAQRRDRDVGLLSFDEREPYAFSLAKKTAALPRKYL
jgi:hypothetical protein